MIEDLLTTRQLQDILKVDRVTIYRMLADGRIKGIKVGNQWRFSAADIEKAVQKGITPVAFETECPSPVGFPKHCVQAIQDVCAELGQVAAVTVDLNGSPLTDISQSCPFCQLMHSTPAGRQACMHSWKEMAGEANSKPASTFLTCHAGLSYASAPVFQDNQPIGCLLAGQFRLRPLSTEQRQQQLAALSEHFSFEAETLAEAFDQIPNIDANRLNQIAQWPAKVAKGFQSILSERAAILERLQRINEISSDLSFPTPR